ncbi:MAG: hypothetical protein H6730_34520 [Deltaproteobacteria bacterium]|nr:hypothetical protein [Deltaproteobacteria bacterium]
MRRSAAACLFTVLAAACGGPADRVAVEDLGDADLRVVVARTGARAEARALNLQAPYRYELEPLGDVFERGDNLRIWVLGFKLDTLTTAFPALANRGLDDVLSRLSPGVGTAGPGRYASPAPDRVLFATVSADSPDDVPYEIKPWDQVAADVALYFELPGEQACPPVGVVVRAFRRDDPSRACIYTRNQTCEWFHSTEDRCPDETRIFGGTGTIVQHPDGRLLIGSAECSRASAESGGGRRGETYAYRCGDHIIGVQEQPLDALGVPWIPVRSPGVTEAALQQPGKWAPMAPGALFGSSDAGQVSLRRLSAQGGQVEVETLQHTVVDHPTEGSRAAASADGLTVTLSSGTFKDAVGTAEQCFRLVSSSVPFGWAPLEQREDAARLRLGPGLSPFGGTLAWDIIGDPGHIQAGLPDLVNVRLPANAGLFTSLSVRADPAQVFLQTTNGAFNFEPLTRFPGERALLGCPRAVVVPPGLAQPMLAGPNHLYALLQDRLQLLDPDGNTLADIPGEGANFSGAWELLRTTTRRDEERVVVIRDAEAHIFDPEARRHDRVVVPGQILAVIPGPDLLYRAPNEPFAVYRAQVEAGQLTDTIRYALPPFEEGAAELPTLDQAGVISRRGRPLVAFSAGSLAGILDLETGLATAVPVGFGAEVVVVFEDDTGNETWAGVKTSMGDLQPVRFPDL